MIKCNPVKALNLKVDENWTVSKHCNIKQLLLRNTLQKTYVALLNTVSVQFWNIPRLTAMKCEQKCMIKKQPIHVSFFVRTVLKEIRAHLDQNLIGHTYFGRREFKSVCQISSIC